MLVNRSQGTLCVYVAGQAGVDAANAFSNGLLGLRCRACHGGSASVSRNLVHIHDENMCVYVKCTDR